MTVIGNNIKRRREELGITQAELAHALGYKSKSTINKIEMGINDITHTKIVSFANALGTTPAQLTGWNESRDRIKNLVYETTYIKDLNKLNLTSDEWEQVVQYAKFVKQQRTNKDVSTAKRS